VEDEEDELNPKLNRQILVSAFCNLGELTGITKNLKGIQVKLRSETLITFRYRQLELSEALAAGRVVRSFLFPTFKQLRIHGQQS
jgi:hypothetical protein